MRDLTAHAVRVQRHFKPGAAGQWGKRVFGATPSCGLTGTLGTVAAPATGTSAGSQLLSGGSAAGAVRGGWALELKGPEFKSCLHSFLCVALAMTLSFWLHFYYLEKGDNIRPARL